MARKSWAAMRHSRASKGKPPPRVLVARKAINAFLDRPRRDLRRMKDLPASRLQERADALEIRPPLFKRLQHEQKVCFLIGAKYRYAFFMLDTGMGKTLLACALTWYFNLLGDVNSVLVLVPTRANKTEWAREINKHKKAGRLPEDFDYLLLKGSSEDKWVALTESTALVTVETVGGWVRMVTDLKKKKGSDVLRLIPNKAKVEKMMRMFDGVFVDESTTVKGGRATIAWRVLHKMRQKAQIFFPMTGTPMGRDPMDLWAQFHLADNGFTLGETRELFKASLFTQHEPDDFGRIEWSFPQKNERILNRFLAHSGIQYEVDEADLPTLIPIKKFVTLPGEAMAYYEEARKQLYQAKGNVQEQQNAFIRMRQISSGYVGYDNDEDGKRAQFEFPFNPKLEYLMALLSEIRPDYKRIVFMDYVFSGSIIGREMEKLGLPFVRLYGGTKDPDAERDRWEDPKGPPTLLLSNSMGGFGLNLQLAKWGIYFESPVSSIIRKQTRRRFERQHSPHNKVFMADLLVRDTMDEAILAWHAEAGGLFDAIVRGKARV